MQKDVVYSRTDNIYLTYCGCGVSQSKPTVLTSRTRFTQRKHISEQALKSNEAPKHTDRLRWDVFSWEDAARFWLQAVTSLNALLF